MGSPPGTVVPWEKVGLRRGICVELPPGLREEVGCEEEGGGPEARGMSLKGTIDRLPKKEKKK